MVDERVVPTVWSYLRRLPTLGLAVRFVVFGSQVGGKADQWSDIDLLVVSPQFDGPRQRSDVNLLWRTAARVDSRIEPIPCGKRQWWEDASSAIVEIARRERQRIAL